VAAVAQIVAAAYTLRLGSGDVPSAVEVVEKAQRGVRPVRRVPVPDDGRLTQRGKRADVALSQNVVPHASDGEVGRTRAGFGLVAGLDVQEAALIAAEPSSRAAADTHRDVLAVIETDAPAEEQRRHVADLNRAAGPQQAEVKVAGALEEEVTLLREE